MWNRYPKPVFSSNSSRHVKSSLEAAIFFLWLRSSIFAFLQSSKPIWLVFWQAGMKPLDHLHECYSYCWTCGSLTILFSCHKISVLFSKQCSLLEPSLRRLLSTLLLLKIQFLSSLCASQKKSKRYLLTTILASWRFQYRESSCNFFARMTTRHFMRLV